MKKRTIRLLSLVLCLVSLVTLLPVTALAASAPGMPTDLQWHNYRYILDGELVTYESFGYVSAKAAKPYLDGYNYFLVQVYRNDKLVDETIAVSTKEMLDENDGYFGANMADAFANGSGTYHFTVTALETWTSTSGNTATSKDYVYTKPTETVGKPTNVRIEWPYVIWEGSGDEEERFECEIYYKKTKDAKAELFYNYIGYGPGSYELPGWSANGYYYAQARGISSDVTVKYHSDWVTSETVSVKIKGPSVKISNISSSGKPKITWEYTDDYSNKYVLKYEVYRATSEGGTYTLLTTTDKSSYTDSSATAGKKYYYKVRGLTTGGLTSYSSVVSSYCDLARPTAKVTNTSKGYVKVSWDKVSGASKYTVYRAEAEDGPYTAMKTTTSTSYTNTSGTVGKTYYYKVKALHEKESANSAYSKVVSGTRTLAAPSITLASVASSGKIKVSWEAVTGAKSYNVYRATSKSGEYKLMKNTTSTSYTNTSAVAGKTYYYRVEAVAANGSTVSAKSSAKYRTCDLPRPDVTVTVKSNGDAKISFVRHEDAEKYEIYRATSKSGTYTKIKTLSKSSSYTDTSVKAGKTYYYKVKAIHSNSAANSAYSSIDKVSIPK